MRVLSDEEKSLLDALDLISRHVKLNSSQISLLSHLYEKGGVRIKFTLNGKTESLAYRSSFTRTMSSLAKKIGIKGKFHVFLNDNFIKPSEAPYFITDGMKIVLKQY